MVRRLLWEKINQQNGVAGEKILVIIFLAHIPITFARVRNSDKEKIIEDSVVQIFSRYNIFV